ncbi:hypothetical protein [Acetobacterium sp.]|uniref:hypothetical protein n=1 Tax=Acetobacterium sp. TaxID=1872094 RepID=UPI00351CD45C
MPSNYECLITQKEYALFANACPEAERVFASSPAMSAVGCRKALELAVKCVYAVDTTIEMPYKDNLQSLIQETSFRYVVVYDTRKKMPFIIKLAIWRSIPKKISPAAMPSWTCGVCLSLPNGSITATGQTIANGALMRPPFLSRRWRWIRSKSGCRKAC